MAGRRTDDALLISTIISNSAIAKTKKLFNCYIYLVKAYDTLNRDLLFEILKRRGLPPNLLGMIQGLYHNVNARVRIDGKFSEPLLSFSESSFFHIYDLRPHLSEAANL